MPAVPTTVLYIAGSGRSGTTLLGCILGQLKGFYFVGETIFSKTLLAAQLCGCGARILECDFWTTVRRDAGGDRGPLEEGEEFFGLARSARWRHLPLTFVPGGARRLARLYGERWHDCERLYAAVAAASGARVIVDSSKSVPYGRMLSVVPGLDLRVVHVVRDPRAVAHSWKRVKPARDRSDGYMRRLDRGKATVFWTFNNLGAELLCRHAPDRYLRLQYEDFVRRPREWVERIRRLVGEARCAPAGEGQEGSREPPFIGDRTVELHATHSVWGNPDRFRTGAVELVPDDEWMTGMPAADRRFVTAVTWPFLVRYGYPVAVPASRGERA